MTDVAGFWTGTWSTATSIAGCAQNSRIDFNRLLTTKYDVTEFKIHANKCILTALSAITWSARLTAAKKGVENVSKTKATRSERILATHVVLTAFIGIAKYFVGVCNKLESLVGFFGVVHIRVQLTG
jgi:hypothetical protein